MATPLQINIKISGIELLTKKLEEKPKGDLTNVNTTFDVIAESKVNPNTKNIIVFCETIIKSPDNYIFGSLKIAMGFLLENFEDVIKLNDKGQYIIPPELDFLIRSTTIPTVRGMVFSEFRGTYLHKAVMPLIYIQPPNSPQTEDSNQQS